MFHSHSKLKGYVKGQLGVVKVPEAPLSIFPHGVGGVVEGALVVLESGLVGVWVVGGVLVDDVNILGMIVPGGGVCGSTAANCTIDYRT